MAEVPPGWPENIFLDTIQTHKWLGEKFERSDGPSYEDVQQFRVFKVVHYKETFEKFDHEFLVVTILDSSRASPNNEPPADACLDLRYERSGYIRGIQLCSPRLGTSSLDQNRTGSILMNQPATRKDYIQSMTEAARDELKKGVRKGNVLTIREMMFDEKPTVLDLAAVLEAHSTLSTSYRMYTTMCYWFAGSTYEILGHIHGGKSVDVPNPNKRGKQDPIRLHAGYRLMREREDEEGARGLAKLVKSFELFGKPKKKKGDEDEDPELDEVEKELRDIPSFEDLCKRSSERRDQALLAICKRDEEKEQSRNRERELEARKQKLVEWGREREREKIEWEQKRVEWEREDVEWERKLAAMQQQVEELTAQLAASQATEKRGE